jgi:uncharacterized radical SAM superfamily Fe-S cluster-containing enzyme
VPAIYNHTQALCPTCGTRVPARIVEREAQVFLDKFCERHGYSSALISSDADWYRDSVRYVKPKQVPLQVHETVFKGCPESCGSCPEHQQHTCLPVIEITANAI